MKKTILIFIFFAAILPFGLLPESWAAEGREEEQTEEGLLFMKVPVVTAASRMEQPVTEAPASVTIITAADIKTYGYRTLADILNSTRGLFVTSDRNYQYVGVRGFNRPGDSNSRILLLVDGYRVNETVYDAASIGTAFFLDVDLIDRVEVVRGPGSSIYGSNAFFGVVNVITRRGRDMGGWEVSGEAASFGTGKGRLAYGQQKRTTETLFSATYYGSKGQDLYYPEFDTPATNNGVAQDLDYDRAKRVYGRLALGNFTFSGAYSERTKGVPTAPYGTVFNDPRTHSIDSQTLLHLGYRRAFSERIEFSSRLYYGAAFYDGTSLWNQPPVTIAKARAWAEWLGVEAILMARYGEHKLVAGAEWQDNFRQDQKTYDIEPAFTYVDDRHSSQRRGFYIQDETALSRTLLVNAGLRSDDYSTVGNSVNPRLALIYHPQLSTGLKLLYGTAFRAPNAFELYYADNVTTKAALDLKPEEITTYEFVVEHQLRHDLLVTASVYQNDIHNLINQIADTDGLMVYRNIGEVRARGAEIEVARVWIDDRRLRASYARQITRDLATDEEITNSPRHLAKLNYSMPMFGNVVRTGAELQYTSSRKTLSNGSTGGYTVANLTLLSSKIAKGLELSASVYNLFDKSYADPGRPEHVQDVIQQDGRNYRVKLTYLF